jgi:hypothetical protein
MRYLRNNTATITTVGPFLDKTDGITLETGLTITNERISFVVDANDGSAPTLVLDNVTGATSGTANDLNYIANCDAGLMQIELAAANVNYLGRAFLTITDAANHCPVFHEFTILPANIYDSMIAGTDLFDVSMTQILGTAVSAPATAGILDVNLKNIANAAVSATTAQLGVNVVQISADATAADNAESFFDGTGYAGTNNVIPTVTAAGLSAAAVDLVWDEVVTSGHATAGSAGKLMGDNVNAPIATVDTVVDAIKVKTDYLPSATAGAAGGVFIAGSNAATSVTTALTANITGNLSGSVGSVTGAVGSVAANGITATSIAADAVNAAAVKADAVTKIQNGLATPTNITAGTITTVTNLTNNTPTIDDTAANHIVTHILAAVVEGSLTLANVLRLGLAVLTGKASGGGTTSLKYRSLADDKDRVTLTVDASGNRSASTLDGS